MESFLDLIGKISSWLWGPPFLILLLVGAIFLTVRLGFVQFKYLGYIFKQTLGKIFVKQEGKGTIPAFQALTTAVACTVGAGNIVGVPTAIMFGGPGAIFWMWVIGFLGMGMKFTEVVLAQKYREKNEAGEYVGGPMYYMTKGLHMKWLAIWFAIALMIEVIPSTMVQANSVAGSALEAFNINPAITGIIVLLIVGAVVIGGIKRIGKVTEKLVPFMAILYVGVALVIVIMNLKEIPGVIGLIFGYAFRPMAAVGGFTGAAVAATVRWGFARGIYSNEAGLGTAPIAHAAAIVDHPVRQGFWSIIEVFIDTIVICSMTAFCVLTSGVWKLPDAMSNPAGLTALAFRNSLGSAGGVLVTISLLLFVISTIIVLVWYGEKQAEFLFGYKGIKVMRYVYVASIFVGAIGVLRVFWEFLDITLAAMLIPNMIAILLLNKEVVKSKDEFFASINKIK
jgi:AGCS family alanine or glycine:cation symporter